MQTLKSLHEQITQEIINERNSEMAASIAHKRQQAQLAESRQQSELESLQAMGLNVANLNALDQQKADAAQAELNEIQARMDEQSTMSLMSASSLAPGPVQQREGITLTPAWSAGFSDQDVQSSYSASSLSGIDAQVDLTNGTCKNYWNWASGGGWGCTGGVGSNQQWIEFGFWFRPEVSKFYAINPLFRFRGYYIVRADDGVFTCKNAQVVVSAWTNVHQYNWKGWNHVDVLNLKDDNININKRLDTDRHTYNSYLLGGGDWAYIRCTIGLYVRAQGSGSYAKNDFATGNANYLCVPHVHVI